MGFFSVQSDNYCMSVCPMKEDPSSVVLCEVSYFPSLGFFQAFPHLVRGSKGRGCYIFTAY